MRIALIAAAALWLSLAPSFAESPAHRPGIGATTGAADPLAAADFGAWPTCSASDASFAKLKCSAKIFD